jgi:hypothetical protein
MDADVDPIYGNIRVLHYDSYNSIIGYFPGIK